MVVFFVRQFHHVQHAPAGTVLLFLFLGMALESTCVPLPSEVVLPPAGVWARTHGAFALGEILILAVLGSVLGSLIMYAVGRYGGYPVVERYGRYFLVKHEHLEQAHAWIQKYGPGAVAFARFIFGVRHLSSLAAGILRMDLPRFVFYTFLGAGAWDSLGILLGYFLGNHIESALKSVGRAGFAILALLIVVCGVAYLLRSRSRRPLLSS